MWPTSQNYYSPFFEEEKTYLPLAFRTKSSCFEIFTLIWHVSIFLWFIPCALEGRGSPCSDPYIKICFACWKRISMLGAWRVHLLRLRFFFKKKNLPTCFFTRKYQLLKYRLLFKKTYLIKLQNKWNSDSGYNPYSFT